MVRKDSHAPLLVKKSDDCNIKESMKEHGNFMNNCTPLLDQTEFSDVKDWEVQDALKEMNNGKAPGRSNITADLLKERKEPLIKALTTLSNECNHLK